MSQPNHQDPIQPIEVQHVKWMTESKQIFWGHEKSLSVRRLKGVINWGTILVLYRPEVDQNSGRRCSGEADRTFCIRIFHTLLVASCVTTSNFIVSPITPLYSEVFEVWSLSEVEVHRAWSTYTLPLPRQLADNHKFLLSTNHHGHSYYLSTFQSVHY